jgi:hypothetical protein
MCDSQEMACGKGSACLKTQQRKYPIVPDDNPKNAMKTEFVAEF